MDNLCQILNRPSTFEEMASLIQRSRVIDVASLIFVEQQIESSAKTFLTAWLIARFPSAIENSPDAHLLELASNVKNLSQDTENLKIALREFVF